MKHTALAAFLMLASAAHAAEPAKPAPAQAPTAPVQLNADEMNVIFVSLNKMAATCSTDADGCAVGLRKASIQVKLEAAFKSLAPAPEAAKK